MHLLFIPLKRIRSESLREKCLFSAATFRPATVEGRLTDNCTVPASRLHTLRRKLGRLRIHLSREICKLTDVSRILEQNHVVGIETHCSRKLVCFGKRFWARKTTLMFLWCEPFVHMSATVSLLSCMTSSIITSVGSLPSKSSIFERPW